jgi:hypothetical protein
MLGDLYFYEKFRAVKMEPDYLSAYGWYLKAAEKGDTVSMNHVGEMAFDGIGCEKNSQKAKYWLRKAIEKGNPFAVKLYHTCFGEVPSSRKYQNLQNFYKNYLFPESEWMILERKNNKTLLLARTVIGFRQYHSSNLHFDWATSDMRKWLSEEYYNSFTPKQRKHILLTEVINSNLPSWGSLSGEAFFPNVSNSNTKDYIFLLSKTDFLEYFRYKGIDATAPWPNRQMKEDCLRVVKEHGQQVSYFNKWHASWWWLRSSAATGFDEAIQVMHTGGYDLNSDFTFPACGVRPAFWIDL